MSDLREVLRANLFDGDESGVVTMPIARLLDDLVEVLEDRAVVVAAIARENARAVALAGATDPLRLCSVCTTPDWCRTHVGNANGGCLEDES